MESGTKNLSLKKSKTGEPLDKVKTPTLAQSAVTQVRAAIFDGRLTLGQKVSETLIASQLGISRAPLREALRQLEYEGLITRNPWKGAYVTNLDMKDGAQIAEIRNLLEVAAIKQMVDPLGAELGERLGSLLPAMARAVTDRDLAALVDVDREFHESIVLSSGNFWLHRVWKSLDGPMSLLYLVVMNTGLVEYETIVPRHKGLADAIAEQDLGSAIDFIRAQHRQAFGKAFPRCGL